MTQPSNPPPSLDEFILHPSVAAGWWLDYLPYAAQAIQFRTEYLRAGRITVSCIQDIEFHVLDLLAQEISKVPLGTMTVWPLANDVFRVFQSMRDEKALAFVSNRVMARRAFQIAARYGVPFADALYVAAASGLEKSLILADRLLYARLLEIELSGVRVILLQEHTW